MSNFTTRNKINIVRLASPAVEKVDIKSLNAELKTTVSKINTLRSEIDKIVAEIEA